MKALWIYKHLKIWKLTFCKQRLALIPAWISDHIFNKVWFEITYPLSNFKRLHHCSLEMDKEFNPTLYNYCHYLSIVRLTHWGRMTHICVSKLNIIGSDNGLSLGRCQAIIWTNAGILLIGPIGTNFSEILSEIHTFHSRKCIWKCRLENGGHFVSAAMC